MKEELHLFIIWEHARYKQEEIIQDISKYFEILKIYEFNWGKDNFSNNLSRFYGTNLPKGSHKEVHCGTGKFLLIVLKDTRPNYEERITSKGPQIVNTNLFDKKAEYRNLTGGGHKIHATNSEKETNHDLTLLLGKNIKDFLKENNNKWNGKIEEKNRDLLGFNGWNTVSEMFYALNNCTNYAILRNYETLPKEIYENDHNDIDIICESKEDVAYILNAIPNCKEEYRVQYKTNVEGRIAYFDLRYIGDNYYEDRIEKDILKRRVYNEKGFYTLNQEDYFYTLLYHALIQKPEFKEDYKAKLFNMRVEKINEYTSLDEFAKILKKWMLQNEYCVVVPNDETVMLNQENSELLGKIINRKWKNDNQIDILLATYNGEKYLREQLDSILKQTYSNFRLIISDDCSTDNTKEILREYEKKDERVKIYYQKQNLGILQNFEFLLKKVENNLYALSDQDDIWLPEKLEKSLENMTNNNSDLVFGDLLLIDKEEKVIANSFWRNKGFYKKIKKDKQYKGLLLNNYVTGCTILSKKKFLDYILPLPKTSKYIIHDYWIAIVVGLKGKISYVKTPFIKYRQHSENQIGYKMKSKELSSFDEIRKLFIDVKIDHFKVFKDNKDLFTEEQQKENEKILQYYNMLKDIKYINFKKLNIFFKIYKYENFIYFLANLVILNFPIIGRVIYKRR